MFDLTHIDATLVTAYLKFAKEAIHSKIAGIPDLSSEVFFWERVYHESNIRGIPLFGTFKDEHCKQSIKYAIDRLRKNFDAPLKVTEVGCGPTSQFYTQDLAKIPLEIVTVDPLAKFYMKLHEQYHTGYDIKCIGGFGENLQTLFPKESFHLVYSQNAIDHSMKPDMFVENMVKILKVNGFLVLHGYIKEGSNGGWLGLHQWDIEPVNDDLMLTNRSRSIQKSLTTNLGIKMVSSEISNNMYTRIYQKNKEIIGV